ncbi:MAG: bifunctional shikimate kinase/3-dehydroquinate synthase [Candidatus Limnocylindrales bacterium]
MDVVLVGLPGSGKSVIGRRFAQRHGAAFLDLDQLIERLAGRPIPAIFEEDGEAGFRALERMVVAGLGPADPDGAVRRVIAAGGGTPVDPRNRWRLYRGRSVAWLDGPPEVLAQRLRRSVRVRPLVAGHDPIGAVRQLAAVRRRFYAPAIRLNALAQVTAIVEGLERAVAAGQSPTTVLLEAETPIGSLQLGHGNALPGVLAALGRLEARRAILVSEPGAWQAAGNALAAGLEAAGLPVETVMLPQGEDAKRLPIIEEAARTLARLRMERGEPLVAIGGGALGDPAGFLAATYLRGVPLVHVPTTLVAQIDSAIGGKNAVDLPEGKNLVGAFYQPAAIVVDVAILDTLPERQRRAALGEAVKMAVLGDERLFELLEIDGPGIAAGDPATVDSGSLAELVERCAWAKVEVVLADERERAGRINLNLGHSLGHAIEAAAGYRELLHGEAVGYGLRGVLAVGRELDLTPPDRAERILRLLDALGLAVAPPPVEVAAVRAHLGVDKKHAGGRLRWVLPVASGVVVRTDVPEAAVEAGLAAALAGSAGSTSSEALR